MKRFGHVSTAVLVLAGLSTGRPQLVSAANCTVLPGGLALVAHIPSAGTKFTFPFPDAGVVIPMDIDAAQGAIVVRRGGLPTVSVDTAGPPVEVALAGPDAPGQIDGAGNVVVPDFPIDTVLFGQTIPTMVTLSTGAQAKTIANVEYGVGGAQLDFATGVLTLEGADIIPFAPIVEEPVVSGIRLACRLEPVPDAASLPPPVAQLDKVKGLAKTGKPEKGDTLTLKGRVRSSGEALDPTGPFFVRLLDANARDLVSVLVTEGQFTVKGHRVPGRTVKDDDVSLLAGQKVSDAGPLEGKRTVRAGGSDATIKFSVKVTGLDLSRLGESGRVAAEIDGRAASVLVTVSSGGNSRRIK